MYQHLFQVLYIYYVTPLILSKLLKAEMTTIAISQVRHREVG